MQAGDEWWKAFADPMLDELIVRANVANTSIEVASARHRGLCIDATFRSAQVVRLSLGYRRAARVADLRRRTSRGEIANAQGELEVAVARYREQILVAFRDVEDQLAALRLLAEQADAQTRAVGAAARTTMLSDAPYRNGFVSHLDLLDARRSELRNRRQALPVRAGQYQATVGVVRARGRLGRCVMITVRHAPTDGSTLH